MTAATSAWAGEAPLFSVNQISLNTIYTATQATSADPNFKPHINFPYMGQRADGTLEANFSVGQTQNPAHFGIRAYSNDGGQSWFGHTQAAPIHPLSSIVKPFGQTSIGLRMSIDGTVGTTTWAATRYTSNNGAQSWSGSTCTYVSDVPYINAYQGAGDIVQIGTMLLSTSQAMRPGVATFETVLWHSVNNGTTWTRRSTIASHTPGPNLSMGSEGPNESSVIQLTNGTLLSVFRTGQPFPTNNVKSATPSLFYAHSPDNGQTWTQPKMLGLTGAFPLLRKLDYGAVALTTGRYGAKVMFADATGTRWTEPHIYYDGSTSGHTEMRRRADGKWTVLYDESSFYPPSWDASPPAGYVYQGGTIAHAKSAVLDIRQQRSVDAFKWALEYHGDTTPDLLTPNPWERSQSGANSAYLWADLGQDYLRLDTGTSGPSSSLYYTHGGAGTIWDDVNFSDGVVIELRARAGNSTAEGAGTVFIGDGVNGYAALELTGTSVNLEGFGGNPNQATFLESSNPGFSTSTWHTYQVVVAPDPSAGGAVRAKVFLDGNYATPILSIAPNTGAGRQLWVGDGTGVNNGRFDVDYIRYAAAGAATSFWSEDASGDWSLAGNWSAGAPSGADRAAYFLDDITAPRTVTLSGQRTVGHLKFDSLNPYTLSGDSLSLSSTLGPASVVVERGSHTIAAPVALLSHTTISVAAGATLSLAGDMSAGEALSLRKRGAGALAAMHIRVDSLDITAGTVRVATNGTDAGTSVVGQLTLASGAQLDLTNNDLVVRNGTLAAVQSLVSAGYAGGAWNGAGINSSVAAAGATTALAVANNSELNLVTFSGQAVGPTDVLVAYTRYGDADLSGSVSLDDFTRLAAGFGSIGSTWTRGDFNYDGFTNLDDFTALAANFGLSTPANDLRTIPEPATAAFILALGVLLTKSRKR